MEPIPTTSRFYLWNYREQCRPVLVGKILRGTKRWVFQHYSVENACIFLTTKAFHSLISVIETPPGLWGWYGIDLNDHVPVDVGYGAWDAVDRRRVDFALSEGTQGVGWGYCSPEYPLMSIE